MIINRVWAMSNKDTFKIPALAELLVRFGVNGGWADPFCGTSTLAEYRNDYALSGLDSLDWAKDLPRSLLGVVVDPPYSARQIAEHYKKSKGKVTFEDCQNIYSRIFDIMVPKIKEGGHVITCGWHSNGAGKVRGCKMLEILLIQHGGAKHDTIVTVEQKVDHDN